MKKHIVQRITDMINEYWSRTGSNPIGIQLTNDDFAELKAHCNRFLPSNMQYEPVKFYGVSISCAPLTAMEQYMREKDKPGATFELCRHKYAYSSCPHCETERW